MRVRNMLAVVITSGALVVAGCGADQGAVGDRNRSTVSVEAANGTIAVPVNPQRIVSLSPTHTESLYAIGAGARVVAVDDQSDFPTQAPRTALSGFKPNAEAVIDYQPELVIVSNDTDGIVAALGRVKIPVLVQPAATNIDEALEQIRQLGIATGQVAKAAEVVAQMRESINNIVARAPKSNRPLSYFHELDPQLHTVTSATFIGRVYAAFGLENIADAADRQRSGYPQFSSEALLQADPDLIFLADGQCCGQNLEVVAQRPGWQDLRAVREGAVVVLDEDVTSRWGPRLPDFYNAVAEAIARVPAPA